MTNLYALMITLFSGIFFFLGYLIVKFSKHKKELSILSSSMAFVIMIGMVFFDLIPEMIELTENFIFSKGVKILFCFSFLILGFFFLKLFDIFLPHHHHEHHESEKNLKEHDQHMVHIGIMLTLSIIIHNMIEGISLYVIACDSLSSGFFLSLAIGLHNLPLGVEISGSLLKSNHKVSLLSLLFLIFSTFLGSFLLFIFHITIHDFLLFFFVSVVCGMILYIALCELLNEIFNYKKNRYTIIGFIIGIFFLLIMTFLE